MRSVTDCSEVTVLMSLYRKQEDAEGEESPSLSSSAKEVDEVTSKLKRTALWSKPIITVPPPVSYLEHPKPVGRRSGHRKQDSESAKEEDMYLPDTGIHCV